MPARIPPTANVVTMTRSTLIPIRAAISLSSATARMDLPVFVFATNSDSPIIDTSATTITTSWGLITGIPNGDHRFAGSSVLARWAPPFFRNGLDPDTTEGAINLVYALPNFHVEYVRAEPPGIPTAFWRSVGPSHNVFVTESFIDELAAAAKLDAVAYRRALLGKSPRAKAVLDLAAERAGWGQPVPPRVGRGMSLQFVF